jgi:uncharacterized membrane protein
VSEDDESGQRARGDDDRAVGRTLALSDGIFAIAMTLVAFQIQLPNTPVPPGQLTSVLAGLGDRYIAYFITFAVIGLFWLSHHRLFRHIVRADDTLMLVNLLFLMAVAALPFPSAVLGSYGGQRPAEVLYASSMAVTGFLMGTLTVVAHRRDLLAPGTPPESLKNGLWRSGTSVAVFVLSIPVALFAPSVTPYTWLVLLPLRIVDPFGGRKSHSGPRTLA